MSFSILWAKLFTQEEIQKANGREISLCWAIVCSCYKEYSHYTTDYNNIMTTNRLTFSAFIKRYTEEDFAIDNQLQKLVNIE